MAIYDYACGSCGEVMEMSKSITNRDDVGDDTCPHCNTIGKFARMLSTPLIGYSTVVSGGYGSKVPDGFKDVLRNIHKKAPGSNLDKISSFI